jgi:RNA polymerase sigma-70 factor (ECF subfamily)
MPASVVSEATLLERARSGDSRAVEQLLERHERQVYRFSLRMCGHEAEAQDVLQETLLAAWKHLPEFRGEARLSTWLYQVARSFCLKQRRLREGQPREHEALDSEEVQQQVTPPEDARVHAREVGQVIEVAMRSLPADYREAVLLRDVEGLSTEDAAEVIGIHVGALKSRLHRGRLSLKQQLASVLDERPAALECPELAAELAAYAGSDIDQAACEQIERHLSGCVRCATACESLKRTVSMCRAIPGGEVPASVKAAVRSAVRLAWPDDENLRSP